MQQKNNLTPSLWASKKRKKRGGQLDVQRMSFSEVNQLTASYDRLLMCVNQTAFSREVITEIYRLITKNRRMMAEKYLPHFPAQALLHYQTALKHYEELAGVSSEPSDNNNTHYVALNPSDLMEFVDICNKIYAICNNSKDLAILGQALGGLENTVDFYRKQLLCQPNDLITDDGLRNCLEAQEKIRARIKEKNSGMSKHREVLDLPLPPSNNNSKPKNLLYSFNPAQFLLDEIAAQEKNSDLLIRCNSVEQAQDIIRWLPSVEAITMLVKLSFTLESEVNLKFVDLPSVFQLKQWCIMTDRISDALEKKEWNKIFGEIVAAKCGAGLNKVFIRKRIALLGIYHHMLSKMIRPEDAESYEHTYNNYYNKLNAELAVAETRRKERTSQVEKSKITLPSQVGALSSHNLVPTFFSSNNTIDESNQITNQQLNPPDNPLLELVNAAILSEQERELIKTSNYNNEIVKLHP